MKRRISTTNAPSALGPYSQAVESGGVVYVSGQLGIIPGNGSFAGENIKAQTEAALKNIKGILAQAQCKMEDVVKTTVFLSNICDFDDFNEVYGQFFDGVSDAPARSCIQAAKLPKGALVEIDAIAVKDR